MSIAAVQVAKFAGPGSYDLIAARQVFGTPSACALTKITNDSK
jgi:hypothetical protein